MHVLQRKEKKITKVKLFSHLHLFVTLWTVACQAPLSMGFSRQESWSESPFPSSGEFFFNVTFIFYVNLFILIGV